MAKAPNREARKAALVPKSGEPRSSKPVQPVQVICLTDCQFGRRGKVLSLDPATAKPGIDARQIRRATPSEAAIAGL